MVTYLAWVQEQYAEAFAAHDEAGMADTSNDLALAYGVLGNPILAAKWADEYLRLMLDSRA